MTTRQEAISLFVKAVVIHINDEPNQIISNAKNSCIQHINQTIDNTNLTSENAVDKLSYLDEVKDYLLKL